MSLSDAQHTALWLLRAHRWTRIGTRDLSRPTLAALAAEGLVRLADKRKHELRSGTAARLAQYAALTGAGLRKRDPKRRPADA